VAAVSPLFKEARACNHRCVRTILRFLIAAVACTAIALPWIEFVKTVEKPPPKQALQARGIVWAGRVFVDRAAFAAWLGARGQSYETWVKRHPPQIAAAASTSAAGATVKGPAAKPLTGRQATEASPTASRSPGWLATVAWPLLGLVLVLGFVAAVVRSLRRVGWDTAHDSTSVREDQPAGTVQKTSYV
jgi:hypothetical protein